MTLLTAGLLTCAVLWWLEPPRGRSLGRLRARTGTRGRRAPTVAALLLLVASIVLVAGSLIGPIGGIVAVAAAEVAATVAYLIVGRHTRRSAQRARREVAGACAAVAGQVRVGRVGGDALGLAAQDFAVLEVAARTDALGGDLVAVLRSAARRPGCHGLDDLASAWRLAQTTGAPLAGALERVADSLRSDQAVQSTVGAELAGPRATSRIMAVLPLCGIAMGYALGGDPVEFLVGGPAGWACLLLGVSLACAGVIWIDRLAGVAERGVVA